MSIHQPLQRWARILVQVTIYRRLLIGRDGHLDQSEAYDISYFSINQTRELLSILNHYKCPSMQGFSSIRNVAYSTYDQICRQNVFYKQ